MQLCGDSVRKGRSSAVWIKLRASGIRLLGIIDCSSNYKSKDITVLTNRINALCDKHKTEIKKTGDKATFE